MSTKFEGALQEAADKIMHDLPEEIAVGVSFQVHEGGDALVLSYPRGLHGTPEMQLLSSVVRRYGGAFVSRGKDDSYFLVPRPKPHQVVEKPKEEPGLGRVKLPYQLANDAAVKRGKGSANQASCEGRKGIVKGSDVAAAKALIPGVVKESGPFEILQLESLADLRRSVDKLAIDVPLALSDISVQLGRLTGCLEKFASYSVADLELRLKKLEGAVCTQSNLASHQQFQQPPKVQRGTNPREGFEEDGLIWLKVFDGVTVKYLKATEKDNAGRGCFQELVSLIKRKGDKPYAMVSYLGEKCNCFLWVFDQGPVAIGKKKCRQSRGGVAKWSS